MPEPIAPSPMDKPAPRIPQTVVKEPVPKSVNSKMMAITRAKIEEDSAIAWPTSMVFMMSPEIFTFRDMAELAIAAV